RRRKNDKGSAKKTKRAKPQAQATLAPTKDRGGELIALTVQWIQTLNESEVCAAIDAANQRGQWPTPITFDEVRNLAELPESPETLRTPGANVKGFKGSEESDGSPPPRRTESEDESVTDTAVEGITPRLFGPSGPSSIERHDYRLWSGECDPLKIGE